MRETGEGWRLPDKQKQSSLRSWPILVVSCMTWNQAKRVSLRGVIHVIPGSMTSVGCWTTVCMTSDYFPSCTGSTSNDSLIRRHFTLLCLMVQVRRLVWLQHYELHEFAKQQAEISRERQALNKEFNEGSVLQRTNTLEYCRVINIICSSALLTE